MNVCLSGYYARRNSPAKIISESEMLYRDVLMPYLRKVVKV